MILLSETKRHTDPSEQRRTIGIKSFELETIQAPQQDNISLEKIKKDTSAELEKMHEELAKMKDQKVELVKQAGTEINKLKTQWHAEKEEITKRAEDEGYSAGFERGKQESFDKYGELLKQANSIISTAQQDYQQSIDQAKEDILSLSVHIAEKIIRKELTDEPNSFISLVSEAINEVKEQSSVSIYLHPDNYTAVIEQKQELVQVLGPQAELMIFIDYELKPGACIIEHSLGQIDASIDTQLTTIKSFLEELRVENKC